MTSKKYRDIFGNPVPEDIALGYEDWAAAWDDATPEEAMPAGGAHTLVATLVKLTEDKLN